MRIILITSLLFLGCGDDTEYVDASISSGGYQIEDEDDDFNSDTDYTADPYSPETYNDTPEYTYKPQKQPTPPPTPTVASAPAPTASVNYDAFHSWELWKGTDASDAVVINFAKDETTNKGVLCVGDNEHIEVTCNDRKGWWRDGTTWERTVCKSPCLDNGCMLRRFEWTYYSHTLRSAGLPYHKILYRTKSNLDFVVYHTYSLHEYAYYVTDPWTLKRSLQSPYDRGKALGTERDLTCFPDE